MNHVEKFNKPLKHQTKSWAVEGCVEKHTVCDDIFFSEHFTCRGYIEQSPLPLTPPNSDKTVPFVGSSINAFKSYLETRTPPENPFYITQPCVRTHDIVHAYSIDNIPFGMPFFHIFGTFSGPGTYEKVAGDVLSFFFDTHALSKDKLCIKPTVPEKHDVLLAPFRSLGVNTEVDYSRFYTWKYGVSQLMGEGVTLFLSDPEGKWWDVGNIVSICDAEKNNVGVEFGVGVEFFKAALHGSKDPFYESIIAKIETATSPFHKKVLTYLEVALCVSCSLSARNTRSQRMAKKYAHAARYLCSVYGYTEHDIALIARNYAGCATTELDVEAFLRAYSERASIIMGITSVFEDILHNPLRKNISDEDKLNFIAQYMVRNGICNEELKFFIEKEHPNNSTIQLLCKEILQ